ncbi:glycoside hydrolase superfamily [Multifurca ochricompacta]|uniref:beta-glucosidase n=1 Tax=Multifurca ochricompacta TaxID=376703 RepID=A0AAD4LUK6_9AGAM|nr:glycoside hydrolase superfamily [Multifurca ochricompacta]
MRPSILFVLLGAGRTLSASSTASSSPSSSSSLSLSLSPSSSPATSSSGTLSSPSSSSSSPSSPVLSSPSSSSASLPTTSSGTSSSVTSSLVSSSTSTSTTGPPIPGVYPLTSPKNPPSVQNSALVPDIAPAWAAAYKKAKAKVATFTLEQKVNITTGVGWQGGRCVGNTPAVGDFPGLCLEDSPLGVRLADFATAFPAAINAATTWKRSLLRARGVAMGQEHVGKGVNIALGRNWEGFGADPFLASTGAYETILGLQSAGVQACAKHYINNVMAGVASIMCSYNLTLNGILKHEFGFQGFVMSDWSAQHSTISAITGLDMTMPGTSPSTRGHRTLNNTIPEARVDDMATRILAAWYLLGQDSPNYPKTNFNAFQSLDEATNEHVDVQDNHGALVREIGAASAVLLKNVNGALPLKKPRRLVLIGSDAAPAHVAGPNEFGDQGGVDGTLAMGWGPGKYLYVLDFHVLCNWNNLTAWHNGDALVKAVAAQNKNTIVVVNSVGPVIVDPWIDHPNVTAVVWAGLAGTEAGNALVDILYGDVNPSGRLPYTIAKSPSDYSAQLATGGTGNQILDITYTEGCVSPSTANPRNSRWLPRLGLYFFNRLFIDYRHFDAANIVPRFEFGFGLSYTTFKYTDLSINAVGGSPDQDKSFEANWAAGKPSPQVVGASTALWLHRPAFEVSFTVQNAGKVAGTEVRCVIPSPPPPPPSPPPPRPRKKN